MKKNKYFAAVLSFLFGGVGIHCLYLKRYFGFFLYILMFLITPYLSALFALCETIYFLIADEKQFDKRYN